MDQERIPRFKILLIAFVVLMTSAIYPAHAADRNLFEFEHECRSALNEYRANPGLAQWARNADCNWHPELGPKGMWYIY